MDLSSVFMITLHFIKNDELINTGSFLPCWGRRVIHVAVKEFFLNTSWKTFHQRLTLSQLTWIYLWSICLIFQQEQKYVRNCSLAPGISHLDIISCKPMLIHLSQKDELDINLSNMNNINWNDSLADNDNWPIAGQ